MNGPQTTIALTFLTHIISGVGGVKGLRCINGLKNTVSKLVLVLFSTGRNLKFSWTSRKQRQETFFWQPDQKQDLQMMGYFTLNHISRNKVM